MKDRNKEQFNDFSITVSWAGITENEYDIYDKVLFEKSISVYIEFFNSIPPTGILIQSESGDIATIDEVIFNGLKKSIHFHLSL